MGEKKKGGLRLVPFGPRQNSRYKVPRAWPRETRQWNQASTLFFFARPVPAGAFFFRLQSLQKVILRLAIPTVLAMLSQSIVNDVDVVLFL